MASGKARTREEIQEIVGNLGYELLGEYMGKNLRRVVIRDSNGYKYDVYLGHLMRGKIPPIVETRNPFTLPNISLWLKRENKSFKLCENNIYEGNNKKLFFQCLMEECQEIFDMRWGDVYSGEQECPFCIGKRVGKHNNLAYRRPDLAKEWNYDKNEYSPEEYTCGSREEVAWICSKCGHSWSAIIKSRSNGHGCKKCKSSEGEKIIFSWLIQNLKRLQKIGIINKPIPQKRFEDCRNERSLPFDFGLENYNHCWILIEYHGKQHFVPVDFAGRGEAWAKQELNRNKKHDKIKEKYCIGNDIPLVVIPCWDFDNIEKILEKYFFG